MPCAQYSVCLHVGKNKSQCLSIGHEGLLWGLVIIGSDTKYQQVSLNSLVGFLMDKRLAFDYILAA